MVNARNVPPARLVLVLGLLAGTVVGVGTVALASPRNALETGSTQTVLEASHLPPLLTVPGEDVVLRFETTCLTPGAGESAAGCRATGTVVAREGARGEPVELALEPAEGGVLRARVPASLASAPDGFTYYAVLRAEPDGEGITVPAGGAAAPFRSLPMGEPVRVDLGKHVFGAVRKGERVAFAPWGSGSRSVGLEPGRQQTPVGASSFDVDEAGSLTVLDEVNHRLLRWRKGAGVPSLVPVSVAGTIADLTVATDGSFYVLETVAPLGRGPLVRRFDADGRELETIETAERTASRIVAGPNGPLVLAHPSHQWFPLYVDGAPAETSEQRVHGYTGRPVGAGRELVVLRHNQEVRVALVTAPGVRRSWRITSETPLAEVQLAEVQGTRAVIVVRAYSDLEDEFVVLVLDGKGVMSRFAVSPENWAETAPLSRFRLAGSSLYRLGSSSAGTFVDRFDLEVR